MKNKDKRHYIFESNKTKLELKTNDKTHYILGSFMIMAIIGILVFAGLGIWADMAIEKPQGWIFDNAFNVCVGLTFVVVICIIIQQVMIRKEKENK